MSNSELEEIINPIDKIDPILSNWIISGQIPDGLMRYNNKVSVMLLVTDDPTLDRSIDPLGSFKFGDHNLYWVHTTVADTKELHQISNQENVIRVVSDNTNINFANDITEPSIDVTHLLEAKNPLKTPDASLPQPSNLNTRDILGTNYVEDQFGYDGAGTVVNVHDTGVDFGHTAMIGTLALDSEGRSTAFDGAGGDIAITNQWSEKYYRERGDDQTADLFKPLHSNANNEINISGYEKLWVWSASNWGAVLLGEDIGIPLPDTFSVANIPGNRTGYNFGITMVHNGIFWNIVPFVLVDTNDDTIYDAIYFDWITGWFMSGIKLELLTVNQYLTNAPFEFSSSSSYTELGNPYLSADILSPDGINEQDGYIDMSIGSLGNVYDVYNISGNFGNGGDPIFRGIDEEGIGFAFFHDYQGHGTGVSGSIAAQDIKYQLQQNGTLYSVRGVAPGTKIMGTMGLITSASDIYSMLWIQGYEPNAALEWTFVNDHIANISSNSWGFSDFANHLSLGDDLVSGFDFYSLFFELLSPPGFISPDHPGILFVISSGNAGPGYGTGGSPINPSAILVGASTSMWWRENINADSPWGSNQPSDQVIAFSSPGPTTTNYPKIDIVNVGAYDYSVLPSIPYFFSQGDLVFAGGNGTFTLFSGTSEAAPYTSAVLSIIHEAWKNTNQASISPDNAKIILKSSAVDLGYDLYRQGAGRAAADRAVHLILNGSLPNSEELFLINSTDAYAKAAERINIAFDYWFDGTFKLDVSDAIPNGPVFSHPSGTRLISDTVIYGGIISPGDTYTADLKINNLASSVLPYRFETYFNDSTSQLQTSEQYKYHRLDDLFPLTTLQEADFVQFSIAFPYVEFLDSFENNGLFQLLIGEHDDLNSDGIVDDNERILHTFSSSDGAVISVFSNAASINANTLLIIRDEMLSEDYEGDGTPGANYTLGVRAFKRVVDSQIGITNSTNSNFQITINPTLDSSPGFYQGFIRFEGANGGSALAPYTYSVPLLLNNYTENGWNEISGLTNRPMDNGVFGAIDWSWREPSGDWRFYDFELNGSGALNANTLAFEVEWTHPETVLDVYIYDFEGRVVGRSDINYIDGGFYNSTPNAPPTMQRFLINVTSHRLGETLSGDTFSGSNRFFTMALHATSVSEDAVLLDMIAVRAAWLMNNISDFLEPQAILTTSGGGILEDGTPYTEDIIGLSWSNVTSNPIPTFTNTNFPTEFILSIPEILHIEEIMIEDELQSGSDIIEHKYEIDLAKGMRVSIELEWTDKNTDMDLYLIRKGDAETPGNSILRGAAGSSNPEKGTATISESGAYIIAIDYFRGLGGSQSYTLDFIAKDVVFEDLKYPQNSLEMNLTEIGVREDDFMIESVNNGWNQKFSFESLFRFDAYAPSINFTEHIPEKSTSGQVMVGTVYDASTYNFTLKQNEVVIVALMNVNGTQEIYIDASLIPGLFINTKFNISGIDQFGHIVEDTYTVYRTDNTLPIFTAEPDDREVLIDEVFTLNWMIDDVSDGDYFVRINGQVIEIGSWQSSDQIEFTYSFDELGTKFIRITVTDAGGNSFGSTVKIFVVIEYTTTSTSDQTSSSTTSTTETDDNGDGSQILLPATIAVLLIAGAAASATVFMRRRANMK